MLLYAAICCLLPATLLSEVVSVLCRCAVHVYSSRTVGIALGVAFGQVAVCLRQRCSTAAMFTAEMPVCHVLSTPRRSCGTPPCLECSCELVEVCSVCILLQTMETVPKFSLAAIFSAVFLPEVSRAQLWKQCIFLQGLAGSSKEAF